MKTINIWDIIVPEERKLLLESLLDENGLHITIYYPAVFWSAKVLRDLIVDASEFFSLDRTWTSRLTLIADELNNNAIEYWSREEDVNKMMLDISTKNDTVDFLLEVTDSGKWEYAKKAIEMEELRKIKEDYSFEKHQSIRWRGLFLIIKKLADELYFRDEKSGGLTVWIKREISLDLK